MHQPMPQPAGLARSAALAPTAVVPVLGFLRRQSLWALAFGVASLAGVYLGSRGLIRDNQHEPIFDGVVLGVIMLVLGPALTAYWAFDTDQPDSGFPRRGLGIAVLLAGLPWAVLPTAAMLAWPALLRGGEHPWHVDASLPANAAGLAIVALLLWTAANLGMAATLPLFAQIQPLWLALVFVVPFLTVILVVPMWGVRLVDGSLSAGDGLTVGVVFLISLILAQATAMLTQRRRTV